MNVANPYGLPELAERVPVARTYPAKGARVGFRFIDSSGTPSRRHGFRWTPAVVERLSTEFLYVRGASNGLLMALDLCDRWEIAPADELAFWRVCHACKGAGEIMQVKALDPSDDVKFACVECGGWGEIGTHPFRATRRRRS